MPGILTMNDDHAQDVSSPAASVCGLRFDITCTTGWPLSQLSTYLGTESCSDRHSSGAGPAVSPGPVPRVTITTVLTCLDLARKPCFHSFTPLGPQACSGWDIEFLQLTVSRRVSGPAPWLLCCSHGSWLQAGCPQIETMLHQLGRLGYQRSPRSRANPRAVAHGALRFGMVRGQIWALEKSEKPGVRRLDFMCELYDCHSSQGPGVRNPCLGYFPVGFGDCAKPDGDCQVPESN